MPGRFDIGGYFQKLTRRGRGGRRTESAEVSIDSDVSHVSDDSDDSDVSVEEMSTAGSTADGESRGGPGGTQGGRLKAAVRRGRSGARSAADKVATTAKRATPRGRRPELPPESSVAIEYSPRIDGDPDPGEVVWAWVPFEEDASLGKDRPVVIIGRRGSKLVGVPLTTKQNDREAQINMGTGGWDPKRRTSYARIWRMLDVDPDDARREGAVLDAQRFEALVRAVDKYYDVTLPTKGRSSRPSADPADDYDDY